MYCIYFLLILSATILTEAAKLHYPVEEAEGLFEEFIDKHGRQYKDHGEKQKRFEIFKKKLNEINEKNANPEDTAEYGINKFSDMSEAEFKHFVSGISGYNDGDSSCSTQDTMNWPSSNAPDSFDWRDKNVVSPVKNQQQCKSCWAFSATGTLESQYAIKHKKNISVSEQQIIDCDTNNGGCSGGWPYKALSYAITSGMMTEDSYPYEGMNGTCQDDPSKTVVKVSACTTYSFKDEDAVKEALYSKGPLSICVCSRTWSFYNGGVLKDSCSEIGHAVLLVGYGTENGSPFWIVKNSWGADWGEQGYIRIERGTNCCNLLGVAMASADVN